MPCYATMPPGEVTSPGAVGCVPQLRSFSVVVMVVANMIEAQLAASRPVAAAGPGSDGGVCDERRAEDHRQAPQPQRGGLPVD
jgi:hypothetical protein